MKRRLLSILLVFVMIASLIPAAVSADGGGITITKQPQSVYIRSGDNVEFSVEAASPTGVIKYIWVDAAKIKPDNLSFQNILNLILNGFEVNPELGILGFDSKLRLNNVTKEISVACILYLQGGTSSFMATNIVKAAINKTPICSMHVLGENLVRTEAIDPTCNHGGNIEYYRCRICGEYFRDANGTQRISMTDIMLPQLTGHKLPLQHTAAVRGTCVLKGTPEYWKCKDCGKYFTDAYGTTEYPLIYIQSLGTLDQYNHVNVMHVEAVPATCGQTGNIEYWRCTDCGKYYKNQLLTQDLASKYETETPIDPDNHGNMVRHEAVKPDCLHTGSSEYYECRMCGRFYSDYDGKNEIEKDSWILGYAEHDYEYALSDTLGDEYHCLKCTVCGITKDDAAHSGGTASCTHKAVCSVCGSEYGSIDASVHNNTEIINAVPATAPADGYSGDLYCNDCDKIVAYGSIVHRLCEHAAAGVSKLSYHKGTEPGCETEGRREYWECTLCNTLFKNAAASEWYDSADELVIAPKGHDYKVKVTAPTCEERGYTTHTCDCGKSYVDEYTTPFGHNYVVWNTVSAATCTKGGMEISSCTRCGKLTYRDTDPLGHSFLTSKTEPTCTLSGYTLYTCLTCGYSKTDDYVDALGHDYGDWTVLLAPNCTETGSRMHKCSHCTFSEVETMPALGHSYTDTVKAPTCTEQGYTYHLCNICGYDCVDSYKESLGHSFGDWIVLTPVTCTSDGSRKHVCSRCTLTEEETVKSTGHQYVDTVKEATCTTSGNTTHVCSVCGLSYVDGNVDPLGHDFGAWMELKAPTCLDQGIEVKRCSRCPIYETRTVSATGHRYVDTVTAPTCTERGYTTHTCHCGDSYVDSYIDPIGHDFSSHVVKDATCVEVGIIEYACSRCDVKMYADTPLGSHKYTSETAKAPSCTEPGIKRYTCIYCEDSYDADITALGHSYVTTNIAPTCTSQGYTAHVCKVCGSSYNDGFTDSLGHDFGEWTKTIDPTCTVYGEAERACSRCDAKESRPISPTGHDYSDKLVAPTCTEDGYTLHTCAKCGDFYKDTYVSASGHDYADWVTMKEPTCTETGEERKYCKVCGSYEKRTLDDKGHHYVDTVIAPTCTEDGYTLHVCDCGYEYKDEYVDALGHDYGEWTEIMPPTCVDDGAEIRYCTRCEAYETRPITKLGHDCDDVITLPTCTEKGFTTHTCLVCGAVFDDTYVDALGHGYGEWFITEEPTCTENGVKRHNCTRCDAYETDTAEALGHDFAGTVTDPTCVDGGYTTHVCTRCEISYVDTPTEALGHEYSNGSCIRCGRELSAPSPKASNNAATGKCMLSWQAQEDAVKYEVYRATSETGKYSRMSTTSKLTYTNTTSKPDTTYYYKVRSVAANGDTGEFSDPVKVVCDCVAPVVKASNNSTTGKNMLSWEKVDGAVKYYVYRATSKTGTYTKLGSTKSLSYTDKTAEAGKSYYYKVKAVGNLSASTSSYSEPVLRTCDCAKPVVKVSNVSSSGKIKLSWAKIDGAAKYQVYRATSKTGTYKLLTATTKLSYTDTSSTAGKKYYYKVKAVGSKTAANSVYSSIVSRTCDCARPELSVTLVKGDPKLSWDKVSGAVKYEIYRTTNKNGTYEKFATTTKTSITNTTAWAGLRYYYKIVAVGKTSASNSAVSNVVNAKAK